MVRVAEDMAHRRGAVGDNLANGTAKAAAAWGHPELSMAVKGQAIPAYDPRAVKGEGLGYATSNRGACHLRGYTPASELLGIPVKTDPLEWDGKGPLLKIFQDLHAFSDSPRPLQVLRLRGRRARVRRPLRIGRRPADDRGGRDGRR